MKILIPTDFSDNARVAMNYALTLFGDREPSVYLLNTWKVPHTGVGMLVSIEDILRDESERAMADLVAEVKEKTGDAFGIEGIVKPGTLVEVIKSLQRTDHFDLIVMGTRGADDVSKKLLGSNTANVLSSADIPVLTVPLDAALEVPSFIALATDFTDLSAAQIEPLLDVVNKFNARFKAVHVEKEAVTETAVPGSNWSQTFEGEAPEVETIYADNVAKGLDQYIRDQHVDLLAIVHHDYGFFEGLFHKSVSRSLAMYNTCPLMVLPEAD